MRIVAAFFVALVFLGIPAPTTAQGRAVVHQVSAVQGSTKLVYFGSRDCSVCRKFVRKDLGNVRALSKAGGFEFVRSEVRTLRDIIRPGAFGRYDALEKAALRKAGVTAVPLFAVVRNGELVDAEAGDWEAMTRLAIKLSR